jgi:hypothetical protein
MPRLACEICGKVVTIEKKEYKYIHNDIPILCSRHCFLLKIIGYGNGHFGDGSKRYIRYNRGDLGVGNVWSQKFQVSFRSRYELSVAEFLNTCGIEFMYEPYCFTLGESSILIPDFYLPKYDCFVEVKGFWGIGKKKKLARFIEAYPNVKYVLIPWTMRQEFK